MNATEWLAAASEARLPPLRRSGAVRLLPHQQRGARRLLALLERFAGALLLDGVGTGKSFTAVAVARELSAAGVPVHAAVPRVLVPSWTSTFARFGVPASVGTHDLLGQPPHSERALLIVDEAHRFANRLTRRHRTLASCRPAKLLLVTATPIGNALDELLALVRLAVADDALKAWGHPSIDFAFASGDPAAVRSIVALVSVRRDEIAGLAFPSRLRSIVRFSVASREAELRRDIAALQFPILRAAGEAAILRDHLWRRLESSPEALVQSLERQRRFYRRAREKLAAGFTLGRRDFAALFEREERDMFQELLFPEAFLQPASSAVEEVREIDRELLLVERLLRIARSEGPAKRDLLAGILDDARHRPGVVFTRAVATAETLLEAIRRTHPAGMISSRRCASSLSPDATMHEILAAFRARRLAVLILTDLAAEGLDLQAAAAVIHYDLPWTEVRLAQRDGRSWRFGQVRPEVRCVYFLPVRQEARSPMRYIARKERLANRYLAAEPFAMATTARAAATPEAVRIAGGGVLVYVAGAPLLVRDGRFTADPHALRPLERETVASDAMDVWPTMTAEAMAMPSRVRVLQRAGWKRGAPVATSTVEA